MKTTFFAFGRLLVSSRMSIFLLVALVFFSSCATVRVSQDYDARYGFGAEHTFGWNENVQFQNSDLLKRDELLAKRFKGSIIETLEKRGFSLNTHPALLVSCTYEIINRLQVDPVDTFFDIGYGRFGRYGGIGISTASSVRQYDQGILVINIHSARTKQLIWKGTGTRQVFIHSTPDEITRRVNEMVEAVLAQFPPSSNPR